MGTVGPSLLGSTGAWNKTTVGQCGGVSARGMRKALTSGRACVYNKSLLSYTGLVD